MRSQLHNHLSSLRQLRRARLKERKLIGITVIHTGASVAEELFVDVEKVGSQLDEEDGVSNF